MIHKMRLVDFAFNKVKSKEKDIEIRVNDKKRKKIKIGDTIIFEHFLTKEEIKVQVVNLYKFDSFKELFSNFDNKRLGLKENDTYKIMENFYSKEEEKQGALAIQIKVI